LSWPRTRIWPLDQAKGFRAVRQVNGNSNKSNYEKRFSSAQNSHSTPIVRNAATFRQKNIPCQRIRAHQRV
jgi:hypothetical protein